MILRLNFADASAAEHVRRSARVVDHDVEAAVPLRDRLDQSRRTDSSSRTSQAVELVAAGPRPARRAHVTTVAPWPANTALMPAPTPRTPPVTRHDPVRLESAG